MENFGPDIGMRKRYSLWCPGDISQNNKVLNKENNLGDWNKLSWSEQSPFEEL